MDKNNSDSSSSVCRKIRQALASNPAVRAVQRITSFNQEPKPLTKDHPKSQSSITNISIQSKPHPHHKAHRDGSGAVPIKFDHSTPKLSQNGVAKGASSERATKVAVKGEPHPHPQHVLPMQGKVQHGVHTEPHDKKQKDINEHFIKFINDTKEKMMRSVTNIGQAQSNHAAAPDHGEAHHGSNKNESHFSDFIHRAREKLRTTTTVRKNNYSKKE